MPTAKQLEAADSAQSMGWTVLETGEIDPRELEINDDMNGRRYSDQDVGEMVLSLLQDGQKSPVCVRRNGDGKLSVVFGFRRAKAGQEIYEAKLRPTSGQKAFKLRYELVDVDDKTAFLSNVVENNERQGLTDIDHAHNIARLRDEFEMAQGDIGKRLNKSNSWISLTLKLLRLTANQQKLVAQYQTSGGRKGISPASAYELADIEDPKERQGEIDKILSANEGRVPRNAVRKSKQAKGGGNNARPALSAKEIRFPFDQIVDTARAEDRELEPWEQFCAELSKFCRGRIGDRAIISRVKEAFGVKK